MNLFCFEVVQGEDCRYQFGSWDDSGNLNSYFGYKARMVIKTSPYSTEALDVLTTENGRIELDETGHNFRITLPKEKTSTYPATDLVYDFRTISANGDERVLVGGEIHVVMGVLL